jgi:uncharacterized protein YjeT (DUF2065 family)
VIGDFLRALALMIIIEGIMPFIAPARFRETMLRLAQLDERRLRVLGLLSLIVGLIGLQLAHWLL